MEKRTALHLVRHSSNTSFSKTYVIDLINQIDKVSNQTMEENVQLISLYDFLGYAAGKVLGEEVYKAAVKAKQPVGSREITNTRYKGKVMLYKKAFLEEYFLDKRQ